MRQAADSSSRSALDAPLAEPATSFLVPVHDRALPAFEHDVEVAPLHGLFCPPAVDDPPLLADERDRAAVDSPRRPV